VEKDSLSSPEDDLSIDKTSCGDGLKLPDELPIDSQIPQWRTISQHQRKKGDTRKKLHLLACRLQEMSFGADWTSPPSGPVKTPGPIATEVSRTWTGSTRMAVDTEDNQGDDVVGDGDAGGNDNPNPPSPAAPPSQPPAGGSTDTPGGGDDPDGGDDNMENSDSDESSTDSDDSNEDEPEDPKWAGTVKFYKAQMLDSDKSKVVHK